MRAMAILVGLTMLCALCWIMASVISPDVIPLAVMMLFGLLAGIPTALLVLATGRQRVRDEDDDEPEPEPEPYPYTPVVVLPAYQGDLLPSYNTPRRLPLPVGEEANRVRRLANRGKLSKMPADFEGETPAGFRKIARNTDDGHFEREEW